MHNQYAKLRQLTVMAFKDELKAIDILNCSDYERLGRRVQATIDFSDRIEAINREERDAIRMTSIACETRVALSAALATYN